MLVVGHGLHLCSHSAHSLVCLLKTLVALIPIAVYSTQLHWCSVVMFSAAEWLVLFVFCGIASSNAAWRFLGWLLGVTVWRLGQAQWLAQIALTSPQLSPQLAWLQTQCLDTTCSLVIQSPWALVPS